MDFYEVIQRRYSCRAYRPDQVDEAALARVLEAARLAPTACNLQPFRIVVAETAGCREQLARIYPRAWFGEAPLLLLVTGVAAEAWVRRDGRSYMDVDVAIVMDHIVLAAANEGLGTCWVAAFDARAAREVFELPPAEEPIVFTPLGHPADERRPRERKPLGALVRRR
jgi:nitroreductase